MTLRNAYGGLILTFVAGMAALGMVALGVDHASRAQAGQGKDDDWDVLVGYSKNAIPASYPRVALRPTVSQPVFVHLRNTSVVPRANLSVKLMRLAPQGQTEVVAEATVPNIAGLKTERLIFKPAPPPKGAAPPKVAPPAKGEPAEPPGYAAPFLFQLWIDDGQKTVKKDLPFIVQQPHEYVDAQASYKRVNNEILVKVNAQPNAPLDPECEVRMVVNAELLPGLIPPKDATLLGKLKRDQDAVNLHASNVQFEQGVVPDDGRVYVDVDGYERAFAFRAALDRGALPNLGLRPNRVRIRADRYFAPKAPPPDAPKPPASDAKPPTMPIQLEVDGLLDQDVRVEVYFDRGGKGKYVREESFHGLRKQTLKLAVGDDGELRCTPTVKDWQFDLNVQDIRGRRTLRVRLLDPDGVPLALANEKELRLFSTDIAHQYAQLSQNIEGGLIKGIDADLFINDTGPEEVRLVEVPAKALPGQTVRLKATARERDETVQAPISTVQFFVGDPKKAPPLPAVYDVPTNTWQADYKVPSTAKEELLVTVKMATSAGLTGSAEGSIPVADPASVTAAIIRGIVVWNDLPQPGVDVKLFEVKGKEVNELKATQAGPAGAKAGVFVFEDVPPGSYIVFASRPRMRGQRSVTVPKGQALVDNQKIEMIRK